jgi:hypothetical protein
MILFLLACIPIPEVSPPIEGSAHFGATPAGDHPVQMEVRLGVAPLGFVPTLQERAFDVSAGGLVQLPLTGGSAGPHAVGMYSRVGWRPWVERISDDSVAYFQLHAGIDGTWHPTSPSGVPFGAGGHVGARIAVNRYAVSQDADVVMDHDGTTWIGVAVGELGVGLEAQTVVRMEPWGPYWLTTLGLSFQFPATVGVVLVPFWKFIPDD